MVVFYSSNIIWAATFRSLCQHFHYKPTVHRDLQCQSKHCSGMKLGNWVSAQEQFFYPSILLLSYSGIKIWLFYLNNLKWLWILKKEISLWYYVIIYLIQKKQHNRWKQKLLRNFRIEMGYPKNAFCPQLLIKIFLYAHSVAFTRQCLASRRKVLEMDGIS